MSNITENTTAYFNAEENARVIAARMIGLKRSADGSRFVKAGKPAVTIADTFEKKGNPEIYEQLKAGFIAARSEGFGSQFAGFTLAEIKSMDRDAVKAHKLKLCAGSKKPVTKAQADKVEKFKKAQGLAHNKVTTGMANLRGTMANLLAPFETKTVAPNKAPKAQTAKGKDTQTGNVSTDTHIESGPVTEVKTSPAPRSIQHPTLIELVNKLAAFDVAEQAVIAESKSVQGLLAGLTRTLSHRNK
jgi:hypothetical protein